MRIDEAVKKAMNNNACIYRKGTMLSCKEIYACIKPTNSYETCMIIVYDKGKPQRSSRSWNPTADDLMADDWDIIKV